MSWVFGLLYIYIFFIAVFVRLIIFYFQFLVLRQLEGEDGFNEFLSVHQTRSQTQTWANDMAQDPADPGGKPKENKKKPASDDYLNFDSDESEDEKDDDEDDGWSSLFINYPSDICYI